MGGGWASEPLGLSLEVRGPVPTPGACPYHLAIRRNPARAQLIVSTFLGKHVPAPVGAVAGTAGALGSEVQRACGHEAPVVLGFAETATALGHSVAARCRSAMYAHTTRRPLPDRVRAIPVAETHSHAPWHDLAADVFSSADGTAPLVVVDDEFSTGATAFAALVALDELHRRSLYVLACLIDSRPADQREASAKAATDMGITVRWVSLAQGRLMLSPGAEAERAAFVALNQPQYSPRPARRAEVRWAGATYDPSVRMNAVTGWTGHDEEVARAAAAELAGQLDVPPTDSTLVLGDEEFMYWPQQIAAALGPRVHTSATTRSPVAVLDAPGYPVRTGYVYPSTLDRATAAFLYNVVPCADRAAPAPGFSHIVFVTDQPRAAVDEVLVEHLASAARDCVVVLNLDRAEGNASCS
jgi:hypothetical protein